jgi:hypothetical protein
MNPIVAKDSVVVTLYIRDEKCSRDRLAPTVSSIDATPLGPIGTSPLVNV